MVSRSDGHGGFRVPGKLRQFLGALVVAGAGFLLPPATLCQPASIVPPMLSVTEGDDGRTLEAHVGETIRVVLPENASTGYRWAPEPLDDEILEALPAEARYGGTAVGSGGEIAFVFRAKRAGEAWIALKHWRSWEGDASVTRRFRVRLAVLPEASP